MNRILLQGFSLASDIGPWPIKISNVRWFLVKSRTKSDRFYEFAVIVRHFQRFCGQRQMIINENHVNNATRTASWSQDSRSVLDFRNFQLLEAFWFQSSVETYHCKRFHSAALMKDCQSRIHWHAKRDLLSVPVTFMIGLRMRANGIQNSS